MNGARTKALAGAVLIGLGVSLMMAAYREQRGCVDCEESAEETATQVAAASVDLNGHEAETVTET